MLQDLTAIAGIKNIKFNGYKIELDENKKGMPVARLHKFITVGKNKGQYKLIEGYYFPCDDRREEWIKKQIERIKKWDESKKNDIELKKNAICNHPFNVGDILYQSWGYEQTNIDFFEVVEKLPKSVKLRPISQIIVEGSEGFMSEYVKPHKGNYTGSPRIRPVKAWVRDGSNPTYYISNGRHSLSIYDGREKGIYQSHYA